MRQSWTRGLAVVIVLLILGSTACIGPLGGATSPDAVEPAPPFSLREFNGRLTTLSDLRGRAVVLNFWASWCVPCRQEMPLFEEVWRAERDHGVDLIGIAIEDDQISATTFANALGVTYHVGLDGDGSTARAFRVNGLPTTVFISASGDVVRRVPGQIDRQKLLAYIDEVRPG